jgi:hypothetical protein
MSAYRFPDKRKMIGKAELRFIVIDGSWSEYSPSLWKKKSLQEPRARDRKLIGRETS